ncbi:trypsin beta-like [Drosophila ficusphila]|uniref:trypsin beta-like n=1 Tax=Drosophila ficusphila TaxID=30025 RepID=UPI0007E84DC4|nr:trypsin beta-like [Drosophila ficusphila]
MLAQWILLLFIVTLISSKGIPERIAGGKTVSIASVPWQAALHSSGEYICGAVIYSEKIILTAAHCVFDVWPSDLTIRVGSSNSNDGGQLVKSSQILVHEGYDDDDNDYAHDIAVIELETNLQMGDNVRSIPLADTAPLPGSSASVSGWGDTESGEEPDHLRETTVKILDQKECINALSIKFWKDHLCAGSPGKDACDGDSGGPLVSDGKLVGIVSFGGMCSDPEPRGVYANVAELKPWILKTIQGL